MLFVFQLCNILLLVVIRITHSNFILLQIFSYYFIMGPILMHGRFREKYSLISEIKNICLHFYLCWNIFHYIAQEKVQKIEIKRVSFIR